MDPELGVAYGGGCRVRRRDALRAREGEALGLAARVRRGHGLHDVRSSFVPTVQLVPGTANNGTSSDLVFGVPASAASGTTGVVLVHSLHPGDAVYSLEPLVVVAD